MKPVKTVVYVALLLLAFTINAPAGEQQTPGATAQPSPTPTNIVSTNTYSPLSEQSGETIETSDYLLFEALKALLSLY
jgi:hypothetical protein